MQIYLAMAFMTFEMLSLIFNDFFYDIYFLGLLIPFNVSVVFFCLGFFLLDMTTELYNNLIADKLLYGKIISQLLFFVFAQVGIIGAGLQHTQLESIVTSTPLMVFNGCIASLVGYKLTTSIMQKLKIYYKGKYLPFRYLASSLPGEIIFSLVFSFLSFSQGRSLVAYSKIFLGLTLVKITLAILFSLIIVPIASLLRYMGGFRQQQVHFISVT